MVEETSVESAGGVGGEPGAVGPGGGGDTGAGTPPAGRRGLFAGLCGLVFLINLARVVFAPLVEPLRGEFLLSAGEAGLVVTLVWLGSALPRLPTGYLLTKVSRHRVVLGAGGVLTLAATATAAADSVATLYAGAFAMGLASGAYFIAANPLVSELFPDRVGRAIGIHGTAAQSAAVAAPLLVGAVLAVATWREAFLSVAAGALLATAALTWTARRASLPDAGREDRDLFGAARRQWPIVATGIAVGGVTSLVWNGLFNFYVTYLVVAKGLEAGIARTLLTVTFAAGVPAFWVTGRVADRVAYVPLLLSVVGGFVVCVLAVTVVEGLPALAAVSAVTGYVVHSLYPAIDTFMLDSLPDRHRASAYAVFSATMMLVQAGGGVLVGGLTDAGVAFDAVFRGMAAGLGGVLVVLVGLYLAGRLPTGASPG